jgi:hypothetical protein
MYIFDCAAENWAKLLVQCSTTQSLKVDQFEIHILVMEDETPKQDVTTVEHHYPHINQDENIFRRK